MMKNEFYVISQLRCHKYECLENESVLISFIIQLK